jgi:DNA (cytosine-5)-methyltransferase 1
MKSIKVVELFAGVGGFRIGLQRASDRFSVVWSNQWEPSTKRQPASEVYAARFGHEGHSNADISTVTVKDIPKHDLLVGGFPCQDYSVARTLKQAQGLAGKKGVLWWEIHRILEAHQPAYLLLENVDRLLKSPTGQRGRDFAVMLASLADLGYVVEWRVINAADYGMPQRRRRVFIQGYHKSTALGKQLLKQKDPNAWILHDGLFAEAFPAVEKGSASSFELKGDLADITKHFNSGKRTTKSPFANAGVMLGRLVHTLAVLPDYQGPRVTLGDLLQAPKEVDKSFYVPVSKVKDWHYFKGGKKETRTNASSGFSYNYSEGAMVFPDPLDKPSRTIVTGEGGASPSRFKHVVRTPEGKLRRLTPVELERLNMFPDGHTEGVSAARRAFFMGNALVTGIVERVGKVLAERAASLRS